MGLQWGCTGRGGWMGLQWGCSGGGGGQSHCAARTGSEPALNPFQLSVSLHLGLSDLFAHFFAVRVFSHLVALLQVKRFSCRFNTNMSSPQKFEYFEYKHIV